MIWNDDYLFTRGVLCKVTPKARFFDKLSGAEVARVVFLCRCNVMHSLEVVHQQPSLCKLCITLLTVVVRVAELVLVQLEGSEEVFATLLTSMILRFGCFCSSSRGCSFIWGRLCVWALQQVKGGRVGRCDKLWCWIEGQCGAGHQGACGGYDLLAWWWSRWRGWRRKRRGWRWRGRLCWSSCSLEVLDMPGWIVIVKKAINQNEQEIRINTTIQWWGWGC